MRCVAVMLSRETQRERESEREREDRSERQTDRQTDTERKRPSKSCTRGSWHAELTRQCLAVDEDRSLSPDRFGAAQRSESVPNFSADFRIRRTHASEVPEKTRAEGLALVDHFHASALGRSFHLTLDEAEEGGNGDAEKEHFAHMVSSFSADDSPNTSKRGKDSPLPRAMGSPTPGTTPRQNSALSRFGRRPHNLSDAPRRASAARLLNQGFEDLAGGNGDSPRGGSGGRGVHAGAWGAVNREGALGSSSAGASKLHGFWLDVTV
ncbi:hypothetical protein T484DRAFT_3599773 [Baffinella frigidus]|nr:hypothetical protein T484DRAFT_3599773 [Cryptophyta sp. CCMP2293]